MTRPSLVLGIHDQREVERTSANGTLLLQAFQTQPITGYG